MALLLLPALKFNLHQAPDQTDEHPEDGAGPALASTAVFRPAPPGLRRGATEEQGP